MNTSHTDRNADYILPILKMRRKLHMATLRNSKSKTHLVQALEGAMTNRLQRDSLLISGGRKTLSEVTQDIRQALECFHRKQYAKMLGFINLADDYVYKLVTLSKSRGLKVIKEEYLQLVNEFTKKFLPFIVSKAKKYGHVAGTTMEDSINDGVFGFLKAIQKFDPTRGINFATCADHWVGNSQQRSVYNKYSAIRVPYRFSMLKRRVESFVSKYRGQHGVDPSDLEVKTECKLSEADCKFLAGYPKVSYMLDSPVRAGGIDGGAVIDTIEDTSSLSISAESLIQRNEMNVEIHKALRILDPRSRQVIERTFGLAAEKSLNMYELARETDVSRQRIQQLQLNAIKKLRDSGLLNKFNDSL